MAAEQLNLNQQILAQALGGQFDAASFYRAKSKGFSDKDIVAAINSAPGSATGQMKFIAQNYEKALSQTSPSKTRGGLYSAGGQEWGPQLMVTPNKYNPLLGGRDPYGGRFATSTTGDDPGQAFAKRGLSFSYGPANAQEYLNQQYWAGQVNTNPEVNYRWNTGDSLDPESDIDNQYGRLAAMDLAGQGGSEEYKKLARERATAYEKQGALGINKWSTGLHESDPRFAQIAQSPADYAKYLTETTPGKGSSEAARWIERALAGEVMTPLGGGTTTAPGTLQGGGLGAGNLKNVQSAVKAAGETGQRLGQADISALRESTGLGMVGLVRKLRAQNKAAGREGGLLTQDVREAYQAAKARKQEQRGGAPTSFDTLPSYAAGAASGASAPKERAPKLSLENAFKARERSRKVIAKRKGRGGSEG
jgi:hypothetical protein